MQPDWASAQKKNGALIERRPSFDYPLAARARLAVATGAITVVDCHQDLLCAHVERVCVLARPVNYAEPAGQGKFGAYFKEKLFKLYT